MIATTPYFDSAGSCPHPLNDETDEGLIGLSDEKVVGIILDNFTWQLEAVDGSWSALKYLSHGDPGMWRDWLRIPAGHVLRGRLGQKPYEGTHYRQFLVWPRSASKITAGMIGSLGYARLAALTWEAFRRFRNLHPDMPEHIKLRFSIATPYSWASLTGFPLGKIDGFIEAIAREIDKVLSILPADKVLISFEYPIEQVAVALASLAGQGDRAAQHFANQLKQILAAVKKQPAHIGLHPCWGDLDNEAVIAVFSPSQWLTKRLQSFKNLRRLLEPMQNASGTALRVVLLPLSAGRELPSFDPKDYEELAKLKRKPGVDYCASICHENQPNVEAEAALRAAIKGSSISFASCGPRCGLARTGDPQGRTVVKRALLLLRLLKE